jgi:hypothetical protein
MNKQKLFSFKKNSSCSDATHILLEIIKYRMRAKQKVFVCGLDASKAFDKIKKKKCILHKSLLALRKIYLKKDV